MKKRVLLGMAALLLSVSLLMAQEIPAGVITAFIRGSSQELSKYMGDKEKKNKKNAGVFHRKQGQWF